MGIGKCKGCGAVVLWLKTPKGKNMACDPKPIRFEPDPEGEWFYREDGPPIRGREKNLPYYDPKYVGYRVHWANCPYAKNFKGVVNRMGAEYIAEAAWSKKQKDVYEQIRIF